MNVIIYARVSSVVQDFERQVEELKDYAKRQKYKVVGVVSEKISGSTKFKERKIAEVLDTENIDGILIWEFSRLGRDTLDVLNIIEILNEKRVWIFSYKENLKTLDDSLKPQIMTTFMLTLLSSVAEMERGTIVSRSISGLKKAVKSGNWTGGNLLPYGYERIDKKLVINDEEAEVVKYIFEMSDKYNYGTKRIADFLNLQGYKTRYNKEIGDREIKTKSGIKRKGTSYKWSDGTIYTILKNPIYIGEKFGKKGSAIANIKLESPAIIEVVQFTRVQKNLKRRSNKTDFKNKYLLEEVDVNCGVCDKTYFPHKRKSGKDNTYKCLSRRYKEPCGNVGIGIPKLDSAVFTALIANKDNIKKILDNRENEKLRKEKFRMLFDNNRLVESQISDLKEKKSRLLKLYLDKTIEESTFQTENYELKKQLDLKETERNNILDAIQQLRLKEVNKTDANLLTKSLKEDKNSLKDSVSKLVSELKIYPIKNKESVSEIFTAKNDNVVMVEMNTNYSDKSISFLISQRTTKIYFIKDGDVYNKVNNTISVIKGNAQELNIIDF